MISRKEREIQRALGLTKTYPFYGSFEYNSKVFEYSFIINAIDDVEAVEQLEIAVNRKYPMLPWMSINAYIDPYILQQVNEDNDQ